MNQEQRDALFGPSSAFSEHKEGDVILVQQGAEIKQGTILHVRAQGPAIVGGQDHPLLYIVDCGEGFPVLVEPSQIVEGTITTLLGTYGHSYSMLDSREQATNLAVNVQGQIVDTDNVRLRVLKARVEGDERQGRVIAECEAVGDEE